MYLFIENVIYFKSFKVNQSFLDVKCIQLTYYDGRYNSNLKCQMLKGINIK